MQSDNCMQRKAIFAGTFNPFTIGHASIVERGLQLFDEIIIVIGNHIDKGEKDAEILAERIRKIYNNEPRISVLIWNGLLVDLAKQKGIKFFIRGIRNCADFEYERNMADINRKLSGIETVFLATLPELSSISSSIVRELQKYGVNVDEFLPSQKVQ